MFSEEAETKLQGKYTMKTKTKKAKAMVFGKTMARHVKYYSHEVFVFD